MRRIGIVSSFNILCGNATYSEVLIRNMPKEIDCIPVKVPYEIQKKQSKELISPIIDQVSKLDAVNIQAELGLYGPTPGQSSELICKIINKSKNVSITMHRVEPQPQNLARLAYNELKNKRVVPAIKSIFREYVKKKIYQSYEKIINSGVSKNACFIVHTNREKKRICSINKSAKVLVHPIVWPENFSYDSNTNIKSCIDNNCPTIGLFGFISEYKNFTNSASVILNEGFNLVIAGGTHPSSFDYGQKSQESNSARLLSDILSKQKDKNYKRIYIKISPNEQTFISLIKYVDIVLIPYFETGQSGSGIASLAIQYGKRVLFSDTHLVKELEPFLNERPNLFDVNLDESLICAIRETLCNPEKKVAFKNYSFKSNIDIYLNSFGLGKQL